MKILRAAIMLVLLLSSNPIRSQLIINEIMATNATTLIETDFYNFEDWVEIYNSGSSSVNLSSYYLSDDVNNLMMWQFPSYTLAAGQYYTVFCDKMNTGKHTNFGLSADGEVLYLSNTTGEIISSVEYYQQFADISFGRNPLVANEWLYCSTPTPGSANNVNMSVEQSLHAQYEIPAGRYTSAQSITLTGNAIKYTTDGSVPKSNSASYSQPVTISSTGILKTRTYPSEFLPGKTYANTYFINEHPFSLPVVSLSFNPEYFYDDVIGIHVMGTNGTTGYCGGSPANWYQDWERAAYFEYFDAQGVKQISQSIGVKMSGGCTRGRDQKSISLYARSKYDNNDFDYPFFTEKPNLRSFKSLLLRNSGNDQDQTLLRDAFIQALVKGSMDLDYQSYQPVIVYFNGKYRGIMNIREKVDEDYFLSNYNIKSDTIDFLERNAEIIRGTNTDYNAIISFITSNSMANDANYEWVANQIDIQEYINYNVAEIYIGNADWPQNNIKYWRKKNGGKWRWILFDTDYGLGFRRTVADHPTFEKLIDNLDVTEPWSTLLFQKLMENEGFKKQFLQTFITQMHSSFHPDWCDFVLDSLSEVIETEIPYNQAKYGRNVDTWNGWISTLRDQYNYRYIFMQNYFDTYFNLTSDKVTVAISNENILQGKVEVNNAVIQHYPFKMSTYKELPLSIKAKPEKGYRFSHWENNSQTITTTAIPAESEWKYKDTAIAYPANWNTSIYDDSQWESGNGQLGYGDGDENTTISYGADPNNKTPTALFRKTIYIADTSLMEDINLGILCDDGAIVYVNGTEVCRFNINAGTVAFTDYAASTMSNPAENSFNYTELSKDAFVDGDNIISCEVHQANATSTDMGFDLTLSYTSVNESSGGIYSENIELHSDTSFNISLRPVFEALNEQIDGIFINEIATNTNLFEDEQGENSGFIELYNSSSQDVYLVSCFLSDDYTWPTRYSIPDSTRIPANGFKVFYCDGEYLDGPLHTPFKANRQGESLMLSQKMGDTLRVLDSITYERLYEDYSYGKYTDGTGSWLQMKNITPGAPNNPDELIIGVEPAEIAQKPVITAYPNPSSTQFFISVDKTDINSSPFYFEIIDLSGIIVYPRVWMNASVTNVNTQQLNRGIYFVRVFKEKDLIQTIKLLIIK
ncbi:MAG: CotH kinase family protein [Bacteroidales bacterium]|nr:CotH kinase family protein [Bacteroidales bacterium]